MEGLVGGRLVAAARKNPLDADIHERQHIQQGSLRSSSVLLSTLEWLGASFTGGDSAAHACSNRAHMTNIKCRVRLAAGSTTRTTVQYNYEYSVRARAVTTNAQTMNKIHRYFASVGGSCLVDRAADAVCFQRNPASVSFGDAAFPNSAIRTKKSFPGRFSLASLVGMRR
jgi:hypothetical protein